MFHAVSVFLFVLIEVFLNVQWPSGSRVWYFLYFQRDTVCYLGWIKRNSFIPVSYFFYYKTRMHSSRMRTARSSSRPGGLPLPLEADTPWEQTPPRADTPGQIRINFPLGCGPGNLQCMLGYHPPGDLLQGMLGHHTPVNRITEACENITLHQLRCGR